MKVAIVYTDDGPGGPCGQDCVTTSAWTNVHIFETQDAAREWISKHPTPRRKRSKYTMCFMEGDDYHERSNSLEFHV